MPWVPVERAGSAGGNSGRAGSCKHMQTSPELMLGVPHHCWACLAGVSGGEKIYLGSSMIMEIYPAVSLVIGGQDGMAGDAFG